MPTAFRCRRASGTSDSPSAPLIRKQPSRSPSTPSKRFTSAHNKPRHCAMCWSRTCSNMSTPLAPSRSNHGLQSCLKVQSTKSCLLERSPVAVLPRQPTPLDRPLPLRFIFPLLFVGVSLAHLTLLRLPYYWDEAGYYIPAAYDFFRTGDLIPSTTLANSHPPLPSLSLALWWQSGFPPAVTRTAMCLIT